MFASIRQSTMFAISCATMATMMSVGGPQARAAFPGTGELILTDTGTSTQVIIPNSALSSLWTLNVPTGVWSATISSLTVGNFSFTGTVAQSNAPGGTAANPTQITLQNATINNNGSSTDTLNMTISVTGYSIPPSPVTMANSMSATFKVPNSGSSLMTSALDPTDAFPTVSGTTGLPTAFGAGTNMLASSGIGGVGAVNPANNSGAAFAFTGTGTPPSYSLTEYGSTTLLAGGEVDSLAWNTYVYGTPAPSSALLAVAGMPVFGLMWMVRRRRSMVNGAAPAIA